MRVVAWCCGLCVYLAQGVTPGKSDIPASGEYSARKAAADRMMQSDTFRAPREAMVGMVDEDEEEEESSIAKLGKAAGGIGQTVNRCAHLRRLSYRCECMYWSYHGDCICANLFFFSTNIFFWWHLLIYHLAASFKFH